MVSLLNLWNVNINKVQIGVKLILVCSQNNEWDKNRDHVEQNDNLLLPASDIQF